MGSEQRSARNRELVGLLLQGCSNRQIGTELGIGEQRVKNQLKQLYLEHGIRDGRRRVRLIAIFSSTHTRSPLPKFPPYLQTVAQLAITGSTNPEIAQVMNTTEQTVKNYMREIFDKCGVWSRTELAARYHSEAQS